MLKAKVIDEKLEIYKESKSDYFFYIKEVYQQQINSDKGLFEPYVLKGTRTVLERVRMSNHPILSNYLQEV